MKLAVIDFDGILAAIEARLARALELYYQSIPDFLAKLRTEAFAKKSDLYWQLVFWAEFLPEDVYIEGSREALDTLEEQGYTIVILTSRLDSLYDASIEWLRQHGLLTPRRRLIMKPAEMQVQTKLLKAIAVYMLVSSEGASEVLMVDDRKENREEVGKYLTCPFHQAETLAQALEITAGQAA